MKSIKENNFTSTGAKFWEHDQMNKYLINHKNSIISTHISPEGTCNLNCSFCSVKKRKRNFRIEIDVAKKYVRDLIGRGLKAVILTGGGEPTLYPRFNELVRWVADKGLKTALITNGTNSNKVDNDVWDLFSWARVSINTFDGWDKRIFIPRLKNGVTGGSFIYTGQDIDKFYQVESFAKKIGLEYVRVLPNCLLSQEDLIKQHNKIDDILDEVGSDVFFHQYKFHGTPNPKYCHQAYFRPYLSEVDGGTVYPCDSLVLNNNVEFFDDKYKICDANEVLDFLDGKINMGFNIRKDCNGCVFTDNVNMLDTWKKNGIRPNKVSHDLIHKEFV